MPSSAPTPGVFVFAAVAPPPQTFWTVGVTYLGGTTYTGEFDFSLRARFGGTSVALTPGEVSAPISRPTGTPYSIRTDMGNSFTLGFPFSWQCTGDVSGLSIGSTSQFTPAIDPMDATMDCVFVIDNTNPPRLNIVTEVFGDAAGAVSFDYRVRYNSFDSTDITTYSAVDGSTNSVQGFPGFGITIEATATGATPGTVSSRSECYATNGTPVAFGYDETTALSGNDLAAGSVVNCTIIHALPSTLTIIEDVDPAEAGLPDGEYEASRFKFVETDLDFTLADGESRLYTFRAVLNSNTQITREPTPGRVVTGVDCTQATGGGGSQPYTAVTFSASSGGGFASFEPPAPGIDITCRFLVGLAGPPDLSLNITTQAVDLSAYGDFDIEVRGPTGALLRAITYSPLGGSQLSIVDLVANTGPYSVTLLGNQGLDVSWACGNTASNTSSISFTVPLGERMSCALAISEPFPTGPGSISLFKTEDPDSFDNYQVTVRLGDYVVGSGTIFEGGLPLTIPAIADGVYSVTEVGRFTDYELVTVSCTNATTSSITNVVVLGGETDGQPIRTGTFTLNTTSPGSADVSCELVNSPTTTPPIVRVETVTVPGGLTESFDYTLSPGANVTTGTSSFSQADGASTSRGVEASDELTISQAARAGFTTQMGCATTGFPVTLEDELSDSFEPQLGVDYTCRFVNTATVVASASLTVTADVAPASNDSFGYAITPSASVISGAASFTLLDTESQSVNTGVGSAITVAHSGFLGYRTTSQCVDGATVVANGGESVSYTPADGDEVECTFSHRKLPTLDVVEDVSPDGLGFGASDFGASPAADVLLGPPAFALADGESQLFFLEPAATVTINRGRPLGLDATGPVVCTDSGGSSYSPEFAGNDILVVALDIGEAVTCTFRSIETPPPVLGDFLVGVDHEPDAASVVTDIEVRDGADQLVATPVSLTGDSTTTADDLSDGIYSASATYPYSRVATRVTGSPSCALGATIVVTAGGVAVSRTTTFTGGIASGVDVSCTLVIEPAVLQANIEVLTEVGAGFNDDFSYSVTPAANVVGSPTFVNRDGETTGFDVTVGPTFTIEQVAPANGRYAAVVECRDAAGAIVATGTTSTQVTPVDLDRLACVFTNTPQSPTLTVQTETFPASDAATTSFGYSVAPTAVVTSGATAFDQGHLQSTLLTLDPQVASGAMAVSVSQASAAGFDTRVGCYDADQASAPASFVAGLVATPTFDLGQNVVCVFQNSVPVPGTFDLTIDVVVDTGAVDLAGFYSFDTTLTGGGLVGPGGTSRSFDLGDLDSATVQVTDGTDVSVSVPDSLVSSVGFRSTIDCASGTSATNDDVIVTVTADETCTITLAARTVNVAKSVSPSVIPGFESFPIEVTPAIGTTGTFTLVDDTNSVAVVPLDTEITVLETAPDPYDATITCTTVADAGPVSPVTGPVAASNSITINDLAGSFACTVTNTVPSVPSATLTVSTESTPASAGLFDYTVSPGAAVAPSSAAFELSNGESEAFVTAVGSTITVALSGSSGFRTTSVCTSAGTAIANGNRTISYSPSDGDDVRCGFVHRRLPTLTIIENVSPDGLGAAAADFTASPTSEIISGPGTFALADTERQSFVIEPAADIAVSRSGPTGLVSSGAVTCVSGSQGAPYVPATATTDFLIVNAAFGDVITCTFPSAEVPPPVFGDLTIGVDHQPDTIGIATEVVVSRGAAAVAMSATSITGDGTVVANDVANGSYSALLTYPYGHVATRVTGSPSCALGATTIGSSGGVAVSRTTTITADMASGVDAACTLIIERAVLSANVLVETVVGDGLDDDFAYAVSPAANVIGSPTFVNRDGDSTGFDVSVGPDFTIEQDAPVGYDVSVECLDAAGAVVATGGAEVVVTPVDLDRLTCVFTNTPQPPTLTIRTVTEPATDPASVSFDYAVLPAAAVAAGPAAFTQGHDDSQDLTLSPSALTPQVSQNDAAGYETRVGCFDPAIASAPTAFAVEFSVTPTLALGQTTVCVFENSVPVPGTFDVAVDVIVDTGVIDLAANFSFDTEIRGPGLVGAGGTTRTFDLAHTDAQQVSASDGTDVTIEVIDPLAGALGFSSAIDCGAAVSPAVATSINFTVTDDVSCTVTLSARTISIAKSIEPAPLAGSSSFDVSVVPTIGASGLFALSDGDSRVAVVPLNSNIVITETAPGPYNASINCTEQLASGPVSPSTGPFASTNTVTITGRASHSCVVVNSVPVAPVHLVTLTTEIDLGAVATPSDLPGFLVEFDGDLAAEPVAQKLLIGPPAPQNALVSSFFVAPNGTVSVLVDDGGELRIAPSTGTDRYANSITCPGGQAQSGGAAQLTNITTSVTCSMVSGAGNISLSHDVVGNSPGGVWPFTVSDVIAGPASPQLADGGSIVVAVANNAVVTLTQTDVRGAVSVSSGCGGTAPTGNGFDTTQTVSVSGFAATTCTFVTTYDVPGPTTTTTVVPPVVTTTTTTTTITTDPVVTVPPTVVTPTTATPTTVTPTTVTPTTVTPTTVTPTTVTPTTVGPTTTVPLVPFAPTPTTTVPDPSRATTPTTTTPTSTATTPPNSGTTPTTGTTVTTGTTTAPDPTIDGPDDPALSTVTIPGDDPDPTTEGTPTDPITDEPAGAPPIDDPQSDDPQLDDEPEEPALVIIETDGPEDVFVDIGDPIPVEVDCAGNLEIFVNGQVQDRVDRIEPSALGLGDHVISVRCDGDEVTEVRAVVFEQEESSPGGQNMTVIIMFVLMAAAGFLFAPTATTRKRVAL